MPEMNDRLGNMLESETSLYGNGLYGSKGSVDRGLDRQAYIFLGHDFWLRLHATSTNILNDSLRGSLGASLDRDLRFNFD